MSFKSQRIRAAARFGFASLQSAFVAWPALGLAAADPDRIAVNVDQAKLVKLPAGIATIVVGNPLIADVTLQNGGVVVVTGKGYGATNFIAMDRAGQVLVDRQIQVRARATSSSPSIAAWNANPTAACRSASAGSRSATARTISSRPSIRPARSAPRPATAQRRPSRRISRNRSPQAAEADCAASPLPE